MNSIIVCIVGVYAISNVVYGIVRIFLFQVVSLYHRSVVLYVLLTCSIVCIVCIINIIFHALFSLYSMLLEQWDCIRFKIDTILYPRCRCAS